VVPNLVRDSANRHRVRTRVLHKKSKWRWSDTNLTNGGLPASSRGAQTLAHRLPCRICYEAAIRSVARLLRRLLLVSWQY
jgi:hypothetical protein